MSDSVRAISLSDFEKENMGVSPPGLGLFRRAKPALIVHPTTWDPVTRPHGFAGRTGSLEMPSNRLS